MKKYLLASLMILALCPGCITVIGDLKNNDHNGKKGAVVKSEENVIRHVVLFRFKDNITPDQLSTIENAFRTLPAKISCIKGFEWGTNVSPENLAQGFTHCFFLTFANEKDRDTYLVHPAHEDFKKVLGGNVDKVLVIDYAAKK